MDADKMRKMSKLFNRIIAPLIVMVFVGFEYCKDWSDGLSYSKMHSNAIVNLIFIGIPVIAVAAILKYISNKKSKEQ